MGINEIAITCYARFGKSPSQGVNLRASAQLLIFPPVTYVVAGELVVPMRGARASGPPSSPAREPAGTVPPTTHAGHFLGMREEQGRPQALW
jgi:hypothetical protein